MTQQTAQAHRINIEIPELIVTQLVGLGRMARRGSRSGCGLGFGDLRVTPARASQDLAHQAAQILDGRIGALVNRPASNPARPTAATTETDFDEVYAVNVKTPFFLVAAIAPAMTKRGSGAIINVARRNRGCNAEGAAVSDGWMSRQEVRAS
jgi:NAD(P)-dependent dehydrogenase (short-subunit alcohol dehydrogenase family)